jgi:sugar lactone lactonase YvrE
MRLLRFLGIVLVVAVGAGSLALSGGKEIRVPQDYKTIQEAINAASEGDTILVDVGTYKETIEIPKGLTLVGAERDKTIIDGGGLELGVVTISSAALVTVRNVTITNGRDGVLVERGAQALLRQTRIAQNKRDGVLVQGRAELLGNLIHNNKNCGVRAFGSGAQVQGSGNIIRDNGGGDLCGDVPAQLKAEGGPPPPVVRLSPSEWTNRNQFTLDWENPDYPARITAAWYKVGGAPTSSEDGRRTTEKPLQLQSPSEGRQAVYLWLEDELGQKDHRNASQASMLLDQTPPTISAAVNPQPNAQGWNNTDVTVRFQCSDALSGLVSCTPQEERVTSEGERRIEGRAEDRAGNVRTTSVTVRLDKTPPTISAAVNPQPNAQGWNNTDVTVRFQCSDALSGLVSCTPQEERVTSEGERRIEGRAEDRAGNVRTTSVTVRLDKTPPTISAAVNPQPNAQGWNNTDVTVRFSCQDALSGVASCTPTDPIQVTQEGQGQTIQAQAVDKAGNRAERIVTVNLDKTKPQLTLGEPQGTLGSEGWYRTDVVVPYTATDNLAGFSGGQRQLQGSARSSGEGSAVKVRVRVEDLAGNAAEAEAGPFKVDQTPPTISAAVNPQPNAQGWNNTDVTVRFQCSDALSGLVSCTPQEERVTSEGERRIEGRAEDRAGNVRTTSVTVRLDKTPPRVSCQPPDTTRWYREDVSVPCTASDSLSGLANSADASFTLIARGEGRAVSTGTRTVADRAGNSVTAGPYTFQIDKTPPTGSLTINDGAASTTSITVTLRITANDNLSGVAQMRFSNDGWTWSGWEPFNPTRPGWNLSAFGGNSRPGKKTVFAQLQDRAGNISTPLQAEIMFRPLVGNPLFVAANGASFSGTGNGTLVKIDISVPFPFPTTIVKGLDSPADAVCGPDKKIYFADWFSGRIYRVEQDGRNLTVLATVTSPQGVTFSDSGDLYVSAADGIWRLRGGRGPVEKVARYTTSSNFLQGAGGLIFIPQGPFAGDLLVVDTGRNRVVRFPAPNFDRAVDFITTGLDRPIGIAVNSQGEIYVSNFASRQINRYNYRGEFLGVLGEQIGLNVYRPIHMEFGPDDTLYTAEWGDFVGEGWVARINISGELAVIIAIVDAWGLALC